MKCKHESKIFYKTFPKYKTIIEKDQIWSEKMDGWSVDVYECEKCKKKFEDHKFSQKEEVKTVVQKVRVKNVVKEWNTAGGSIIQKTIGGDYYCDGKKVDNLHQLKQFMEYEQAEQVTQYSNSFSKKFHQTQKDILNLE